MLMSSHRPRLSADWGLLVAVSMALPLLAMTSLLKGQLPGTHDAYLHLVRLINATLNIEAGSLIPRWGPQLHFGFGYPLGDFYAPGWHILGGLLVAAGAPAVLVLLIAQSVGVVLYPVGGYLLARQFTDRAAALVGAAICLFAPFRFYEVFVQGNLSQFIAMGLIAWVLWAFARCARSPSYRRVAVAALIGAALILMHHPTAAFMIPFTGLYAVFAAISAPRKAGWRVRRALSATLAAYGLALMLAATYWLPALAELQYVSVQSAADQFQLEQNFVPLADLLGPIRAPDRGSLNMPFTLSIGQLALTLALLGGLLLLLRRVRSTWWLRVHVLGGLGIAAFGIYAMTAPSLSLWMAIPKATLILFPWRLMGLTVVALVPAGAYAVQAVPTRWRAGAAGVIIGGLFVAVVPLLFPIYPNVTVAVPVTPETSVQYEIASGNLGGVSNNEYLPRWATQRPDFSVCAPCYASWQWQVFINTAALPAGATATPATPEHARSSAFIVAVPSATQVELRQMYFPGWEAAIDGQPAPIAITAPYGLMAVMIPAGSHRLEVWYAGTMAQHSGDLIALIGVIACLGLGGLQARTWRRGRAKSESADGSDTPESPPYPRLGRGITVAMIGAAVILGGVIGPGTTWFRAAGNAAAPPGADHLMDAVFINKDGAPQIRLIGYSLAQSSAQYGEQVRVRLYWQAAAPLTTGWTVKLALADPITQVTWTATETAAPGGFAVTAWPRDKYVIDDRILTIPANAPPYIGDLVLQIYGQSERLTVRGSDRLVFDHLRIAERGSAALPPDASPISATFGDWLLLRAARVSDADHGPRLTLYWQVLRPSNIEYVLMLHILGGGAQIGTADQPPIPAYPTQGWAAGQYLTSTMDLTLPPPADTIAIGIYDRATVQRLPVTSTEPGLKIIDQGVLLPLRP
jgi:hypothetical protein